MGIDSFLRLVRVLWIRSFSGSPWLLFVHFYSLVGHFNCILLPLYHLSNVSDLGPIFVQKSTFIRYPSDYLLIA